MRSDYVTVFETSNLKSIIIIIIIVIIIVKQENSEWRIVKD